MTTRTLKLTLLIGFGLAASLPATAFDGASGPYLAGRLASMESDYVAAADYYTRALASDPGNPVLLEATIVSQIGRGATDRAVPVARALETLGTKSQIADLVVLTDLAKTGDFARRRWPNSTRAAAPASLVDGLFRAWALVGQGQMSDATVAFDKVAAAQGSRAFGLYHKGLALASVGDFEGADRIFSGEEGGPLRATRRGILAHAEILSQLERNPAAVELIDKTLGETPDPLFAAIRADLAAGKPLAFDMVRDATDGLAEVYFTVASALQGESTDINTLAYARMAEYLAPEDADVLLLVAEILEAQGQHDLATAYLREDRSERGSGLYRGRTRPVRCADRGRSDRGGCRSRCWNSARQEASRAGPTSGVRSATSCAGRNALSRRLPPMTRPSPPVTAEEPGTMGALLHPRHRPRTDKGTGPRPRQISARRWSSGPISRRC